MLRYLLAILMALTLATPAQALTDRQENQCRFQSLDHQVWSDREERRTARCVVERWSVPGGIGEFSAVAACESNWYRFADNDGQYLGLFQHSATYWPERVTHQVPDAWKVGPWWRWTNSRSQIVTTARMVHYSGSWSAWSCA